MLKGENQLMFIYSVAALNCKSFLYLIFQDTR